MLAHPAALETWRLAADESLPGVLPGNRPEPDAQSVSGSVARIRLSQLPGMRWNVAVAVLVAAALVCAARASDPLDRCLLFKPGADAVPTQACVSCHRGDTPGNHPVGMSYAAAQAGSDGLRPAAEVIRRGVHLPEGEVRCTTCHDASSPWKHRIALPPGTRPTPAVNPSDPKTYDEKLKAPLPSPLPPETEVSPKPLCLACHAMD
jgi:hypothetical protein